VLIVLQKYARRQSAKMRLIMQPQGERSARATIGWDKPGWPVTIILCLVPVAFWLGTVNLDTSFNTLYSSLTSLGQLAGLVGIVMYALNLIYATRLRFLEDWFGGLNRVYIAHHILGGLALVLLALHPMFLVARYISTSVVGAAEQILPRLSLDTLDFSAKFFDQEWAVFFGSVAFFGLVFLLVLTLYVKLPYRLWLLTHKFLGVFFFIAGLHVLFISSTVSTNSWLRYYILGLVVLGLIAYTYKTLLGKILIRKYKYIVDKVGIASKSKVSHIILKPEKTPISYLPGQFLFIKFPGSKGVKKEWHPFSISSSPADGKIRVSAKALGDFTDSLAYIKVGDMAILEGAYGRFSYYFHNNPKQIWVAGGIGITPFLSMARELSPKHNYKIDLYYCVNSAAEMIDAGSLKRAINIKHGGLRVIPYVGDRQPTHISAEYIKKNSKGLKGKDIYLCGPPPMMKSLRHQLRAQGVANKNIHSEEFSLV
jgi:predicted ferric reductase